MLKNNKIEMTVEIRCPALPDGEMCNKVLTKDNWDETESFCNDCQNAYEACEE